MFCLYITFLKAALCPLPFSYHRAPLNLVSSSSLYPLIEYLTSATRSPLSFFSRLNKSYCLSLSLYIMCSIPQSAWCSSAGFTPVCQCLSYSGMPKTKHNTPDAASQLLKLVTVLQSQPKMQLAFFATKAHWTLSGSTSCPPGLLHHFPQSHFLASSLPACSSAWGSFIPFVGHLDLSFLKSWGSCQLIPQPIEIPWNSSTTLQSIDCSPQFDTHLHIELNVSALYFSMFWEHRRGRTKLT